jgi:hypothetical protein
MALSGGSANVRARILPLEGEADRAWPDVALAIGVRGSAGERRAGSDGCCSRRPPWAAAARALARGSPHPVAVHRSAILATLDRDPVARWA